MDPIDDRLSRAGAAWRDAQPPMDHPAVPPRAAAPRWSPARPQLASLAGLVAVVLAVVAVLWAVSPRQTLEVAASASPRPIALLTEAAPGDACLLVHLGGTLRRDAGTGLGTVDADGSVMPVRWPYGFSAYEQAGRVVLVDASGSPVAIDGDPVGFGSAGTEGGIQTACEPSLDGSRAVPGAPAVGNVGRRLTEAEVVAMVRMRAAGSVVPGVVVALVDIEPTTDEAAAIPMQVGTVGDENGVVPVIADPALAATLGDGADRIGTFAFVMEEGGLRLISPVEPADDGAYRYAMATFANTPSFMIRHGPSIVVEGWLSLMPMLCPAPAAPGSDGSGCGAVRIASGPDNPEQAVAVQDSAWTEFGAIPGLDVVLPRYGSYLVAVEPDAAKQDWFVIARLDAMDPVTPPLATLESWTGACRGVGLDAVLMGDPADSRVAWLVGRDGTRMDVVWPPGSSARFAPLLEVVDDVGRVVLRAGDRVDGGCTTGPDAAGPRLIGAGR